MSAQQDRSQKVRFYYGNAASELAMTLMGSGSDSEGQFVRATPEEVVPGTQEEDLRSLNDLLESAQSHLTKIHDNRRQLQFLLQDIKRMIG